MAIEVGKIFEGTVTGLAKFGAFVKLSSGETGLCHISEIANDYVKEVGDHLKENQAVKVKVLSIDPKGKISLSIRQASETAGAPKASAPRERRSENASKSRPQNAENRSPRSGSERNGNERNSRPPRDYSDKRQQKPHDFEGMLNSFMKNSDEKLRDVRKAAKTSGRRGNGYGSR